LPQLVSGGDNGTLLLWSESALTTTTPYTGLVAANLNGSVVVAFSPYTLTGTATATRPIVASGGVNGVITLRHGDTGQLIDPFFGHTKAINALAFNPNPANQSLASASDDETVRLWWAEANQPRPESLELRGHSAPVLSLAFNPPGNRLASADEAGEVIVWRLDSHQIVTRLTPINPGSILALSFGPNSDRLFAVLQNGSLIAWNLSTGQEQTLAQANPATTARFNPAGDRLALAHADGRVSLWQGQTGQALGEVSFDGEAQLISLAFEPSTDRLAVGDSAGGIFIFETETLRQNTPPSPLTRLTHAGWSPVGVRNMALSPNERWLATLATDGSVVLWDVTSRTRFGKAVRLGGGTSLAVAFSPDSELVAVSTCAERNALGMCDHTEIVLLETATQQIVWRVQRQVGAIFALLFTPDGETIISGGCDQLDVGVTCISGSLEFTDVATGERQRNPIEAHTTQVRHIALSPDGQTLASTSFDQTVRFWDMTTLQPLGSRFTKHSSLVTNLVFSPDGQTVASASCHQNVTTGCQQGEFMLWNFRTGQAIGQPLITHKDWIWGLDFSPDGNSLLTAGLDGYVQQWDIQLDTWRAIACRIANRNMTPEEWQQMLGNLEPYHRTCA
jgi:WD40 repeat protein